jgi:hypothetical protein
MSMFSGREPRESVTVFHLMEGTSAYLKMDRGISRTIEMKF